MRPDACRGANGIDLLEHHQAGGMITERIGRMVYREEHGSLEVVLLDAAKGSGEIVELSVVKIRKFRSTGLWIFCGGDDARVFQHIAVDAKYPYKWSFQSEIDSWLDHRRTRKPHCVGRMSETGSAKVRKKS